MVNKLRHTTKHSAPKFIKTMVTVGAFLFVTLIAKANPCSAAVQKELAEIFKKNPDKEIVVKVDDDQGDENTANFEMVPDTTDALSFALQNVDKYYPDMKEHLITMTNSFRDEEHQNTTLKLLDEMIKNISNPQQKTGAIIYALE